MIVFNLRSVSDTIMDLRMLSESSLFGRACRIFCDLEIMGICD